MPPGLHPWCVSASAIAGIGLLFFGSALFRFRRTVVLT